MFETTGSTGRFEHLSGAATILRSLTSARNYAKLSLPKKQIRRGYFNRTIIPKKSRAKNNTNLGSLLWFVLFLFGAGGTHEARAPVRHSQKHLAPMAQFGFFLCPRSCRWSTQRVRPRSALAKAAVLRTVFFSFAHPFCALCAEVWAKEKQPLAGLLLLVGAGGRTRTDTDFTPQDFESSASASFTKSSASASFTTPAQITIYHSAGELTSVFATARNVLQDVSCGRREGRMLRGERRAGRVAENFEKMCELAYANLLTKGERAAYNSGVKSE